MIQSNRAPIGVGLACLLSFFLLAGCAGPQKRYEQLKEPYLQTGGGPLVIVDVCVLQDAVLASDDYHMVTESKAGAQRIVEVARDYLQEKNVTVKATLVPYACGVIGANGNEPQLARLNVDLPATMIKRPFGPDDEIADNEKLLEALNVLATSTYDHSLRNNFANVAQARGQQLPPMKSHSPEEIREAAAVVRAALNADSLIYVSVHGYSQSAGKAIAANAGRVLFGVVTGLVTGVAVIPGGKIDGSLLTAATFDLKEGEIKRTSATRGIGDPKKADVVSDKRFVIPLLHRLLHREVTASVEGEKAVK